MNLRKTSDEVLGNSISKVFLFRIAAHIGKWQHGDRWLTGQRWWGKFRLIVLIDAHTKDAHRPGNILKLLLALIFKGDIDPPLGVFLDAPRHANAARCSNPLKPGSYINTVAENIAAINNHVANIDADPEI